MPGQHWNLGSRSTGFLHVEDGSVRYNPIQRLAMGFAFRNTMRHLREDLSGEVDEHHQRTRESFIESLTPAERKIFDQVAYPTGFKRIKHVTIDEIMNRELRKMDAHRADTPEFIERIQRLQ